MEMIPKNETCLLISDLCDSGVTIIFAPYRQTFATGKQSLYIIRVTLGPWALGIAGAADG